MEPFMSAIREPSSSSECSWMTLDPIKAQGCIQISQTTAEGRSDSLWIVFCPLHFLCLLSTPCKTYIIRTVHAPCPTLTKQSQFPLKSYYNIHLLPFAANILIRVLLLLTNQYECILSYLNCLAKRWLNMIFFLFEVIEKWEKTHTETPFLQRLTALFLPLSLSWISCDSLAGVGSCFTWSFIIR